MFDNLTVPIYHRIKEKNKPEEDYALSVNEFRRHLDYYQSNFNLISPRKINSFTDNSVLITVDDGWYSFLQYGIPITRKLDCPVLFLVNPGFVAESCNVSLSDVHPRMNWGRDRYITKSELKNLNSLDHVTIGSHGMCHRNLRKTRDESLLEKEIILSKEKLREWLDEDIHFFSFPRCRYNSRSLKLATEAYSHVFTFHGEKNYKFPNQEFTVLKRIEASELSKEELKNQLRVSKQIYFKCYNFLKKVFFSLT